MPAPKPHVYACTHLSNTASLLLPVSNLTNLLAFAASGLSFTRFAALMALPWLVAIAAEYVVFRRFFATDLDAARRRPRRRRGNRRRTAGVRPGHAWRCTLAGFVVTSAVGIDPAWAAVRRRGRPAVPRAAPATHHRRGDRRAAAALPFCAFVLALGIVVRAVVDNGLADVLGHLVLPHGTGRCRRCSASPATGGRAGQRDQQPARGPGRCCRWLAPPGPGAMLAVLLGVNIGPNLTYAGSLATLLWRRIVHEHDTDVELGEFTRLG